MQNFWLQIPPLPTSYKITPVQYNRKEFTNQFIPKFSAPLSHSFPTFSIRNNMHEDKISSHIIANTKMYRSQQFNSTKYSHSCSFIIIIK
jgi:hypothetical protein